MKLHCAHCAGVVLKGGEEIEADLVVDATGRNTKMPAWLQAAGVGAIPEVTINSGLGYGTRTYKIPEDWQKEHVYFSILNLHISCLYLHAFLSTSSAACNCNSAFLHTPVRMGDQAFKVKAAAIAHASHALEGVDVVAAGVEGSYDQPSPAFRAAGNAAPRGA